MGYETRVTTKAVVVSGDVATKVQDTSHRYDSLIEGGNRRHSARDLKQAPGILGATGGGGSSQRSSGVVLE